MMFRRCCLKSQTFSWMRSQMRTVFTDPIRRKKLDAAIDYNATETTQRQYLPLSWDSAQVALTETALRRKLRIVDFVVEVRDARIPVSTLHPKLRSWIGKKPRILILNKADLISHRDRLAWERHFEQKKMQIIWTAAIQKNGGISSVIRRFFDANFEVNRRRRKTNLALRRNRAVLSCVVGHPNVGKKTLLERLIGEEPRLVTDRIPDKGRPDQLDKTLKWYKVEGGVYMMDQTGIMPPPLINHVACTRLGICNAYENASVNETLLAEHLIAHLGSMQNAGQTMDRIYDDLSVHPKSLPATEYLREVAEAKFDGDVNSTAKHILDCFRRLDYGPIALEMPYMLQDDFRFDEPLLYDKDTAVGIQSGMCSQF